MAVLRLSRQIGQGAELGIQADKLLLVLGMFGKLLGVGIDDDHTAIAIDDHRIPAAYFRGDMPKADHRGNTGRGLGS